MKIVLQKVLESRVRINGQIISEIGKGMVILLGVKSGDHETQGVYLAEKCANLRIFPDAAGKMNLSLLDIQGEALVVSQFTLYGETQRGRRPSFIRAAQPVIAEDLYNKFIEQLKKQGIKKVVSGIFGAMMTVEIVNEGPVTMVLETDGS